MEILFRRNLRLLIGKVPVSVSAVVYVCVGVCGCVCVGGGGGRGVLRSVEQFVNACCFTFYTKYEEVNALKH